MSVKDEVYEALRDMGIAFDALEHAPAHTMEDCVEPAKRLRALMPKNLFLTPRNQSAFYLCVVRPNARFRTADVSKQIGSSRLSFAPEEQLYRLMRTRPGAISPMGLLFDGQREVHLLLDETLLQADRLAFHPCENDASLAVSKDDFLNGFLARVRPEGYGLIRLEDEGAE